MSTQVTILDGSLGGENGNTSVLLGRMAELLRPADVSIVRLEQARREDPEFKRLCERLETSAAFVFATGTYWDSWGSPLQMFLEKATAWEGGGVWLGKPAAVIVTMHSVGGKGVLSRLQGVLNTLGLSLPPMTGLVCSLVNEIALASGAGSHQADLWSPDDLPVVAHNLLQAASGASDWRAWDVDPKNPSRRWLK